ncbi:hypothetical protein CPC08DRAFT_758361 [Agrocybe pediades]|nr:hypothetical protein CPC08DRAFT_758361 [Agrocybe pediades]
MAQYACRCLNVRIISSTPSASPPQPPRDPSYIPVFVNDDGISVVHPQATVRLTSKPEPMHDGSKYSRFTSVTCLFCDLAIYRVHQIISLGIEGNEGILLPTEEWVERDIMKSPTGWIEVHHDSLVGESIAGAEVSSLFAAPFSLLLPSAPSPPSPPSATAQVEQVSSDIPPPESPAPAPEYMTGLKPLFLPPPFTPSHPIFLHLVSIANDTSKQIRSTAEQRILDFIKAETVRVEREEGVLKAQVEVLWNSYRQHVQPVQQERDRHRHIRSLSRSKESGSLTPGSQLSPSKMSSSVTIRDFVPQPVSAAPLPTSASLPRVSALSASLATSRFHHPKATGVRRESPPKENDSHSSRSTSQSGSATLIPSGEAKEANVLVFKRNLNEDINTQASYKYFLDVEEDMQALRKRRKELESQNDNPEPGPSQDATNSTAGGSKVDSQPPESHPVTNQAPNQSTGKDTSRDSTPSHGRDKGKRKVTFNVEPAVVTFKNGEEAKEEAESKAKDRSRDMIFPLEDLEDMDTPDIEADTKQTTLPLLEQPASRPSGRRALRPQSKAAFATFASLRPASLPNPSHMRPMRSQPGVDSSSQSMLLHRVSTANNHNEASQNPAGSSQPVSLSEHDAELLKLVAADTPSHRGAWTPGSKAWQSLTHRQDSQYIQEGENLDSEDTDDEGYDDQPSQQFVPGSLPIKVNRPKSKEPLSLASYLPPSALPEQSEPSPNASGSAKKVNSAALHRAMYAERDRNRAMDPGALDFAIAEEDEEEEEPKIAAEESTSAGEKSRQQALKILQARSDLPEAGMWRSLA